MSQIPRETFLNPTSLHDGGRGIEAFFNHSDVLTQGEYHCHDYYEFYIHLSGGQYYGIGEKLYQLEPNQLFVIPPYVMHGLSFDSPLINYERGFFNVSTEALRVLGFGQLDLDRFFRSCASMGYYTFQLSRAEGERCVASIKRVRELLGERDELSLYYSYGELSSFLAVVCGCEQKSRVVTDTVGQDAVISEVLTYINANYTQSMKVAELARRFGVSVSYLSREFAKLTYRSVYEYILYCRIALAKQLMRSELSLNAIAYQCGFGDYSNFLRLFGKMEGVSPSAYRRKLRGRE